MYPKIVTQLAYSYLLVFPGSLELAHKKGGTIKYGYYHEYAPAAFCYCIPLLVNTIVALLHEELVVGASVLIRKVSNSGTAFKHLSPSGPYNSQSHAPPIYS